MRPTIKQAEYFPDVSQATHLASMLVVMSRNPPLGVAVDMETGEEKHTADEERSMLKFYDEDLSPEEGMARMASTPDGWPRMTPETRSKNGC